ncbi:MAG: nuclear transport factor 2 family protein [Desulfobulbus sp.]|nr:nuclear transport factor 2 family protein [Desulfobulbus sp.]
MNLKKMILLTLIAAVASLVAIRYWPSDERAIRKQVAQIENLGSKARDEKPIESLLRARQLAALFSDPCTLQVETADFTGEYPRKQIQDRIVMARGLYTTTTVSVHDLSINIPNKETARVRCTLRVKGQGESRPVADVHELEAELHKVKGDWLFTQLTLVEVLER